MSHPSSPAAPTPAPLPWYLKLAVWLLRLYIRFVWHSGPWRVLRSPASQEIIDKGLPYIGIFWHGRLLMMPKAKPWIQRFVMLTSYNRAGSFTSTLIKPFNIDHVRGSSADPRKPDKEKGGTKALRTMARLLGEGVSVGITPDGSRGPRMRLSMGVIVLARLTGKPIMPLTFSAPHAHIFKGWDKLVLPWPFLGGRIMAGDPIYIPRDLSDEEMETWRLAVENALTALQQRLDIQMGLSPVRPDSP